MKIPFISSWLEKRSVSVDGTQDITQVIHLLGGGHTLAGTVVNIETAMKVPGVYACHKIISESGSTLPLFVYERKANDGREKAKNHPLYNILRTEPNDEMEAQIYWEIVYRDLLTYGDHYSEKEFNGRGEVVALWPLQWNSVVPTRNEKTKEVEYRVNLPDGRSTTLKAWEMFHVKGFGFNPVTLKSRAPIRDAAEAIGLSIAAQEYASKYFSNGANMGGIIETPPEMTPEAVKKYQERFDKDTKGLTKSHGVLALWPGMKYHKLGASPIEAQALEVRKFQVAEIARIYRVPLHLIGDLDRSTNNNIEQQDIDFDKRTLNPWIIRVEQAINRQLFNKADKKRFYVEYEIDALLRGDIKTRMEVLTRLVQWGVLSPDEARSLLNRNSREDGKGNLFMLPQNMKLIGENNNEGGEEVGEESNTRGTNSNVPDNVGS